MDIKKYIESGILENYVLGLLSNAERREVQAHMIQYPEIRQEIKEIEQALEVYANSYQTEAPAGLEAKILKRIKDESKPTVAKAKSSNKLSWLALVLIGSFIIGLLWLYIQYRKKANDIEDIQKELLELQNDCEGKDDLIDTLQQQLQILREAGNIRVEMLGTDKAPTAVASIIFNPATQKTYLDVLGLPVPPSDKQYQLWAIVDGAPVDMGVFDVGVDIDTALLEVTYIEAPQAFAVTLENPGGNPTPTLEEMVVIGNVLR